MCGIIGVISREDVVERLVTGLGRLSYRGYDSAGIVTTRGGRLHVARSLGKIAQLRSLIQDNPLKGFVGLGHTRWATHGPPSVANTHPQIDASSAEQAGVAVVHNGIIENHASLRAELQKRGCIFTSQTDTEVIVHLISEKIQAGDRPIEAVRRTLDQLTGSFAIAVLFRQNPDLIIASRKNQPPLLVGKSSDSVYLGSDALALAGLAQKIAFLEPGDCAVLTIEGIQIYDAHNAPVHRPFEVNRTTPCAASKQGYAHFMMKEMQEQPQACKKTFNSLVDIEKIAFRFQVPPTITDPSARVTITACGSSFYAGLVSKYWFGAWARFNVDVECASEFHHRSPPLPERGTVFCISQSGETADVLGAARYALQQKQSLVSLVNVPNSALDKASHTTLYTHAGPEMGVASTKSFTCQLAVMAVLSIWTAQNNHALPPDQIRDLLLGIQGIPALLESVLAQSDPIHQVASALCECKSILYMGRGIHYPIALEGALKMKELSYIHAEGFAAGELKHGPLALVEASVPMVIVAPDDETFDRTVSNMAEVAAREGQLVVFTDPSGAQKLNQQSFASLRTIILPPSSLLTAPFIYSIALQLLAYHTALLKGCDVDQPRNLAKSVTVE